MGAVLDATDKALKAAKHLTVTDAGTVAALRELATRIDEGIATDNVSLPSYLKYCESLLLTPSSRAKPAQESGKAKTATKSALASVSEIPRPA